MAHKNFFEIVGNIYVQGMYLEEMNKLILCRLQYGIYFFIFLFIKNACKKILENIVDISVFIFSETKCVRGFSMKHRKYL